MVEFFGIRRRQQTEVRRLDRQEFEAALPEALGIYAEAMHYPKTIIPMRSTIALTHLTYPDFYAVGAFQRARLIGFGYGYHCAEGQWWFDQVHGMFGTHHPAAAGEWMSDAFELCELHVRPRHQGAGVGHLLLDRILTESEGRTVLLSTPEGDSKAHHLYRRTGFIRVASSFTFPGDDREFAILGWRRDRGASGSSAS